MRRPSPTDERPPRRILLWASLLGTPLLWFAWFMAAYAYTEATCGAAGEASRALGVTVTTVLLIATLIVAGLSGIATAATYLIRRRAARTAPIYDDFLPQAGFIGGLMITFILAAHLIPIAIIGACG